MADYHQMWQDLGMDVKTHDLLCEALPGAFGDVYLSQENRPEGMDYFNMVVAEPARRGILLYRNRYSAGRHNRHKR